MMQHLNPPLITHHHSYEWWWMMDGDGGVARSTSTPPIMPHWIELHCYCPMPRVLHGGASCKMAGGDPAVRAAAARSAISHERSAAIDILAIGPF
jgi:hypothetical protein